MVFFSKKRSSAKVLINISEEGAEGAIINTSKSKQRDVISYYTGKKTGVGGVINSFSELTACAGEVVSDLAKESNSSEGKKKGFSKDSLTNFVFIVESPFQYSYLSNISSENEEPVKVSDETIKRIIEKEEPKKPKDSVCKLWNEEKIEFTKKEVTEVTLNGYSAQLIHGKEARHIDLSIFNTVFPKKLLVSLHSRLKGEFKPAVVNYFARSDVDLTFLNNVRKDKKTLWKYVKVNMSDTVVSVVNKGKTESIVYLNKGYFSLMKEVSKEFNVPYDVARSYISIFLSGAGEDDFSKRVGEVVYDTLEEWERDYEGSMSHMPKSVYLDCIDRFGEIFQKVLTKKYPETEVRTLRYMYEENTGHSLYNGNLELAVGTYFVNRLMDRS
ncbi:MAG: hypothetical protein ACQESA_01005 [Patescibacteria group bacterium]